MDLAASVSRVCDARAMRNLQASFGPQGLDNYVGQDEELFCGSTGDYSHWKSHELSFSVESTDEQPALLMGVHGYEWHGTAWSFLQWGKIVSTPHQDDINGGNATMSPVSRAGVCIWLRFLTCSFAISVACAL